MNLALLLVDDDEDSQFFLRRTLKRAGIEARLEVLGNGEAAIAYFCKCASGEQSWPTVVFLDIKMPGLTGFDVLAWLREGGHLGKTVVAMMSTSSAPTDVGRAYSLGAHTYLNKDASEEVLGPLIRSASGLANRRQHAP